MARENISNEPKRNKKLLDLKSMRGLGYIQSSPELFILPHIYSCPPPGKWINFKTNQKPIC
jgi:hypothetical protein